MRLLLSCCLLFLSSCASFTYERKATYEPVDEDVIGTLVVGESDIGDVLAGLGAPVYVWEGVGDAIVLAYGFENNKEWGFSISIPVFDKRSASFNYNDVSSKLEGFVLVFDADERLVIVRAGLLRDLQTSVRLRPAAIE